MTTRTTGMPISCLLRSTVTTSLTPAACNLSISHARFDAVLAVALVLAEATRLPGHVSDNSFSARRTAVLPMALAVFLGLQIVARAGYVCRAHLRGFDERLE